MKTLITLLFCVTSAFCSSLPDAPSQKIFDKTFIIGHAIYGASNAFDSYVTARNVGVCAYEGNIDLGFNPSSKDVAIHAAVEFGAVVAGDALLKWFGRHQGLPKWFNNIGGNMAAGIGTFKHIRGGSQWVKMCY